MVVTVDGIEMTEEAYERLGKPSTAEQVRERAEVVVSAGTSATWESVERERAYVEAITGASTADLYKGLENIKAWVTSAIDGVIKWVSEKLGFLGEAIAGVLQVLVNFVSGSFSGVANLIMQAFSSVIERVNSALASVTQTLSRVFEVIASKIYEALVGVASMIDNAIKNLLASVEGLFTEFINDPQAVLYLASGFQLTAKGIYDSLLKPMVEQFYPREAVDVERAFDVALGLLAMHYTFNFAVSLASTTVEAATLGQVDTVDHWYERVMSTFGLGAAITMIQRAPFEMAVVRPLSYYLHSRFLNEIPSISEAIDSYRKGDLSPEDFQRVLDYHGLYPWWQTALKRTLYLEPSLFALSTMLTTELADRTWLETKLKRMGYHESDIPILVDGLRKRFLRTYHDRIISRLALLYKEKLIDDVRLARELSALDLKTEVQELVKIEAELAREYDEKMELKQAKKLPIDPKAARIKLIKARFKAGELSRASTITELKGLDYSDEEANLIIDGWSFEVKEVIRELTFSDMEKAYKLGIINESEFVDYLRRNGYSERAIKIELELARAELAKKK
jgi:hypothetical protein